MKRSITHPLQASDMHLLVSLNQELTNQRRVKYHLKSLYSAHHLFQ